jgi:hypothetical protein
MATVAMLSLRSVVEADVASLNVDGARARDLLGGVGVDVRAESGQVVIALGRQ